jgi:glycosyltransferase involved in cell wall biosynthesis
MPTRDREEFVIQSIFYFERQDYPKRELLILDDSDKPFDGYTSQSKRIRYLHLDSVMSIGKKRNLGCHYARGVFIAQWDDDDWYAPQRLSKQIAPLLTGECDITGLGGGTILELNRWEFWKSSFVRRVLEGTIAYRRQVWKELAQYPNQSFGECGAFLADAKRSGATLKKIPSDELFVYLLHGNNTLNSDGKRYPEGWSQITEPDIFALDREFYRSLRWRNRQCL